MIVNTNNTPSVSKDFQEMNFSLENPSMIFEILRSKIYSNPILAVVREYCCNALDAHREAGKPDFPIEVSLPTSSDLFFKVKDFGLGISPDRMENVFIKYTASTKRNDNNAIGGFGLGAKVGFAVSDSFNAITIFNGIKYNYMFYIDTGGVGKAILLSQESTSDSSGTEIIVPVKVDKCSDYTEALKLTAKHWKTKPITNAVVHYPKISIVYAANNFAFSDSHNTGNGPTLRIVVDCIEYKLPISYFAESIGSFPRPSKDLILYFNVGDLSLSVSRESIHLNPENETRLKNACIDANNYLLTDFNNQISSASSFDEAVEKWSKLKNIIGNIESVANFFWQNVKVLNEIKLPYHTKSLHHNSNGYYSKYYTINASVFQFNKKKQTIIIYNDLELDDSFKINRLSKLIDQKPNHNILFLKNPSKESLLTEFPQLKFCDLQPVSNFIKVRKKPEEKERESLKNLVLMKLINNSWCRSSQKEFKEAIDKCYVLEYNNNYVDFTLKNLPSIRNQILFGLSKNVFKITIPDDKEASLNKIKCMIGGVQNVLEKIQNNADLIADKNQIAFCMNSVNINSINNNQVIRALREMAPTHELVKAADESSEIKAIINSSRNHKLEDYMKILYSQEELGAMANQFLDLSIVNEQNKTLKDKYFMYFKYVVCNSYTELEKKELDHILQYLINTQNKLIEYSVGEF